MPDWSKDDLAVIGTAEELEIASRRPDGRLGKRVTIWVVPHEDGLYVRSWRGPSAVWFRSARARLRAGGVERDVDFLDAEDSVNDAVDAGYRAKYRRHGEGLVGEMTTPEVRSATLKLVARS